MSVQARTLQCLPCDRVSGVGTIIVIIVGWEITAERLRLRQQPLRPRLLLILPLLLLLLLLSILFLWFRLRPWLRLGLRLRVRLQLRRRRRKLLLRRPLLLRLLVMLLEQHRARVEADLDRRRLMERAALANTLLPVVGIIVKAGWLESCSIGCQVEHRCTPSQGALPGKTRGDLELLAVQAITRVHTVCLGATFRWRWINSATSTSCVLLALCSLVGDLPLKPHELTLTAGAGTFP
mmetsp:Transcript_133387/g.345274  ORF Transcript_133387/g.345274 Transcript_133387/m.345274 type:complete len:237 (+) Transcript_133387:401-1111(+)